MTPNTRTLKGQSYCSQRGTILFGQRGQSRMAFPIDKKLVNFSKENVKECKQCEFRHICKDCRPDSISMKIDDKPWYCSYDVEKGEWADPDEFIGQILALNEQS